MSRNSRSRILPTPSALAARRSRASVAGSLLAELVPVLWLSSVDDELELPEVDPEVLLPLELSSPGALGRFSGDRDFDLTFAGPGLLSARCCSGGCSFSVAFPSDACPEATSGGVGVAGRGGGVWSRRGDPPASGAPGGFAGGCTSSSPAWLVGGAAGGGG